jgi:hypothetical protein
MGFKMAMLGSGDPKAPDGMIIFATYEGAKLSKEQLEQQIKQSMEKQGHSQQVSERRPAETFKVKGKDVPAQVAVVKNENTNGTALQYTLTLESPSGQSRRGRHQWTGEGDRSRMGAEVPRHGEVR